MGEVSATHQGSSEEGGIISNQRGSFNQHPTHDNCVSFIFWSQGSHRAKGEKDKETDHLQGVMSSDDCNQSIRVGSLEEVACELQMLKV